MRLACLGLGAGLVPASVVAFVLALVACGDSADEAGDGSGAPPPPSGAGGGGPADAGTDALPPEQELEQKYGAPVATGRYVWIPNPESGRVAWIDAFTREVRVVEAGHGPTHVAAVPDPDDDVALVLNVLSADATLLRAHAGQIDAVSLSTPGAANALAVSADGRWAIAWTDASAHEGASAADGFQDIAVLDLTPGAERATGLSVGYRPVAIGFDAAGAHAFAVTQDGLAVIDLSASPQVAGNLALVADPLERVGSRDVAITPDGSLALVRREGVASITLVALDDGTRTEVALPAPATDLDLAADGTFALAVVRETGQVAVLPLPAAAADSTTVTLVDIPGALVGSAAIASATPTALLYTNAVPSERLTLLPLTSTLPRALDLHAAVQAVFPTPSATFALVLHGAEAAGPTYPAAMSLVPLEEQLPPKILGLEAPPVAVAMHPAGARALVAAGGPDAATQRAYLTAFPSLQVTEVPLGSEVMTAGIVAKANMGFVAQRHPDGRITFIDLDSAEAHTVTGFELATQVVDGSEP